MSIRLQDFVAKWFDKNKHRVIYDEGISYQQCHRIVDSKLMQEFQNSDIAVDKIDDAIISQPKSCLSSRSVPLTAIGKNRARGGVYYRTRLRAWARNGCRFHLS